MYVFSERGKKTVLSGDMSVSLNRPMGLMKVEPEGFIILFRLCSKPSKLHLRFLEVLNRAVFVLLWPHFF